MHTSSLRDPRASVVDLGRELVVSVPVSEQVAVEEVRCREGVVEVIGGGTVVATTAVPWVPREAHVDWTRQDDVVTAFVRRVH